MTRTLSIAVDTDKIASQKPSSERVYTTGMFLLLAGVLMFFAALVSAWVVRRGFSAGGSEEPLQLPFPLLIANTAVLLVSSAALLLSHRGLRMGNRGGFRRWSIAPGALGFAFLLGQALVCRQLVLTAMATNPDAGFFCILIVGHGVFFAGGLVALAAIAIRRPRRVGLETAARLVSIYWSFLAAIWCMLFGFVFWGIGA